MKKFILSLFVGFVGIISFCNAELVYVNGNGNRYSTSSLRINAGSTSNIGPSNNKNLEPYATFCFTVSTDLVCSYSDSTFTGDNTTYCIFNNSTDNIASFNVSCTNNGASYKYIYYMSVLPLPSELFSTTCPTCPEVNTGEILSGYILESEIDTNYCVGNGLCPNECGSGTDLSGDLQYSNIYINSILHPGKQNIFIDIPDYITRDYSSTGDDFNVYVGSGYDVDYINSVIDINSYRPSSSDFTNIFVSGLTLIFPYIFIALLLLFIWKFIKKFFK